MKTIEITEQNFEDLLAWLDPDRERAGRRYESIRERLVRIFAVRGCHAPEDLADETIDRVTRKAGGLSETYSGDPALYFYAVAKKVFLEYTRRPIFVELPATIKDNHNHSNGNDEHHQCLEKCLERSAPEHRELILTYYEGRGQERIDRRKRLQTERGISGETLRVKALRIRLALQSCVLDCVHGRSR